MIKKGFKMICLLLLLLQCSCSNDIKEIEKLNFASGIGVDYKDGKYHLYIQVIGLNSIATSEGLSSPPETYVSHTTSNTFIDAFFDMYNSAQNKFIWSHITAILISESALKEGFLNVFDVLTRYYEFRLTPWIFVTKDPLDEVLSTLGFFDRSSLETLLHSPTNIYEQSSIIRPIQLAQFSREFFEPAMTTYVPSITILEDTWKKNNENDPKLALNGAFFIQDQQYKGFFTLEQLKALKWIVSETERTSISVPEKENPEFIVVIDDIHTDITLNVEQNDIKFDINVKGIGNIENEIQGNNHLKEMEEKTNEAIKKQIEQFFQLGIKKNIDFLNLEHILYREHNKKWQQISKEDFLQEDLINSINVDISILHSGGFKNKKVK